MKKIKIATRNSPLAMWQAEFVKKELAKAHTNIDIELIGIKTEGDRFLESSLSNIGGKGLFVKELEEALLRNDVDIAVHSMKDVVINLPENLVIPVIMKREDSRDVFISSKYNQIGTIPENTVIGTSSLRRQSQILRLCPNVVMKDLRGNVDTRLGKLDKGEFDAIVLAAAGVKRLGLSERITEYIPHPHLLPAVGQGAIGIECRANDSLIQELIFPLNDVETSICISAERAFSRRLQGGCQLPIAAHASIEGKEIKLKGLVARLDGSEIIQSEQKGDVGNIEHVGKLLAESLLKQGADVILEELIK